MADLSIAHDNIRDVLHLGVDLNSNFHFLVDIQNPLFDQCRAVLVVFDYDLPIFEVLETSSSVVSYYDVKQCVSS